jgi:hypothetical protein
MKSILDPGFRYVPSTKTDIRKTFNRVRKELAAQARERDEKVKPLPTQRAKLP